MRRNDRAPAKGGWVQMGVRGLAGGVGLVSESLKARKGSKAAKTEERLDGSSREDSIGKAVAQQNKIGHEESPINYASATDSQVNGSDNSIENTKYDQSPDKEGSGAQDQEHNVTVEPEDSLEDEWNLDDAQDEIAREPAEEDASRTTSDIEKTFLQHNPLPEGVKPIPKGNLPLPVVLPQRRPKDRSRGFIRAYAPVLDNCGVDQSTWLDFLDTFQKSSAANPWINAINLASFATMFIPQGFGTLVSFAIRQATSIAIELQARGRTSSFLQKANEEFFRPRGLYCLIMTWDPESTHRIEQVNLTATIESRSKPHTGFAGIQSKYRSADGKTQGDLEFPELAPLVFPALDQLAAQTSTNGIKEKKKMAKGMNFVANYWDKRATAEYAAKNPDSALANVPQEKFKSRYADPNHPAASGSIIAFVSGGHLIPGPNSTGLITGMASVIGQAIRGERQGSSWELYREQQRREAQQRSDEQSNRYSSNYQGRDRKWEFGDTGIPIGPISTPIGVYKRVLKKNVLYMMVVNMPSEEEMAAAAAFQS